MALNAEMKLFLSSDVLVLALLFQINSTYKCFLSINDTCQLMHLSINDTLHSGLGKEVSELQSAINQPMPVNCLPNLAPVCIIASRKLVDHVIYTNTELEKIGF